MDNVSFTYFNNIGLRLTRMIGVVWDASITGDNWYSLTLLITKLKYYIDITD